MTRSCFGPGELLLPDASIPMEQWACPAAHRIGRESWTELEDRKELAPAVMRILVPDALLERVETEQRMAAAKAAMEEMQRTRLTRRVQGMVYLERTLPDGAVRRGLVGLVDLEQYEFAEHSRTPVRAPEALAARQVLPRLDRWENASLQSSHILLAANAGEDRLFAALDGIQKETALYEGRLAYGGGSVKGWAVEDAARLDALEQLFRELARPRCAAVLAPVSGGKDLAARAWWMLVREDLTEAERETHPARFCLAEVCSIESPGLRLTAAHRLVMGAQGLPLLAAFRSWCAGQGIRLAPEPVPGSLGRLCFVYGNWQQAVWPVGGQRPLAASVLEAFLREYLCWNPACFQDRLDSEAELRELAADGNTGILLSETNEDLFRGLAGGDFLPQGLFAQGSAREQRYELECRRIR